MQVISGGTVHLLSRSIRCTAVLVLGFSSLFANAKGKEPSAKVVDSGKFGIFVNGTRVGTETFQIEQTATGSATHCDLQVEQAGTRIEQKSDMTLAANGDLLRYEWKELSPGKASNVVVPENNFLIERLYNGEKTKPFERPFMLPPSTVILDDFFFTHRELLAWRFVFGSCKQNEAQCNLPKTKFGGLVPHTGTPVVANIEFIGIEKILLKGAQVDLRHFELEVDGVKWSLWMDDSYKVQRLTIPENNTEVVRD